MISAMREAIAAARPLRELSLIHDEIIRTDPFRAHGVRAIEFGIDPASGTVRVRVGASAVDVMREAFAVHRRVVVTGETLGDSPETLPPYDVEVFHRGDPALFTADLRPNRVRLLVHEGRVIVARQA